MSQLSDSDGRVKLQSIWRGKAMRTELEGRLEAEVAKPSIAKAKEAQKATLPQNSNGELLSLFSPIESFKVFGTGVYVYMQWQRWMFATFALAFAFALPNTIDYIFGSGLKDPTWMTIHTLGNESSISASFGVTELLVTATFVISLFRGRRVLADAVKEVETADDLNVNNDQVSTVWLHGLAGDVKESELKRQMESFGKVVRVSLALHNRELILRIRARAPLLEDLKYRQALLYLARKGGSKKKVDVATLDGLSVKMKAAQEKLTEHDRLTAVMSQKTYACTGDAFVTFTSAEEAKVCLRRVGGKKTITDLKRVGTEMEVAVIKSAPRPLRRALSNMTQKDIEEVMMTRAAHAPSAAASAPYMNPLPSHVWASTAPTPSDILWEGLSTSDSERWWRQVLSTSITLAIACISTGVITSIGYLSGGGLLDVVTPPEGFLGIIFTLIMALVMALPCILCSVAIFATTPIFANVIERHTTVSSMETTVYFKLLFFQVINTAASAFSFLGLPATGGVLGRDWYSLGGSLLMTCLGPLGDCVLLPSLLDWLTLDMPPRRYIFAPRQKTQLGMDRLYIKTADLYLAFRVQLAAKFVVLCLMFGAAIPMLYFCGALFFAYGMLIDRHNLLRNQTPPPQTESTMTRYAHNTVLPFAILLHALMAPIFLFHLQIDDARRENAPTLPPMPAAPPMPPTSPVVSLGGGGGGNGLGGDDPLGLGAVTAGSITIQTATWLTVALSILSTVVIVTYKCCCETRRRRGLLKVHVSEMGFAKSFFLPPAKRDRGRAKAVFSLRPPPRQTYMPPALSAKLLKSFEGKAKRSATAGAPAVAPK